MPKLIDIAGRRLGKTVVLQKLPRAIQPSGGSRTLWQAKCDCGQTFGFSQDKGQPRQCGKCLKKEKYTATHGFPPSGHPEYKIYNGMISRCLNKDYKSYKYYGARGINICDRWLKGFKYFLDDMGKRPPGTSIDRIDNNGDYTPDNCRWAKPVQQIRNRRNTIKLSFNGKDMSLMEWSNLLDVPYGTLIARYKRGLSIEKILDKNVQDKKNLIFYQNKAMTLKAWSRHLGIKYGTVYKRFRSGWPIEMVLKK
jgi:hypothetical protein